MSFTNKELRPNTSGYIHNWLISGPEENPYKTDYFNPNQLEFEKKVREIIADDNLQSVPQNIKLGADGLGTCKWKYYPAGNNWFVDVSKFYFLLTKVEMYASTVICTPTPRKIKARLWTFESVCLWLNGKKTVTVKEPVYKPIKYIDFTLDLNAGENDVFIRIQNLGVRDTRNIFGLQLRENFDDITVKTHDFENTAPIIYAEQEIMKIAVRDGKLVMENEPSIPIEIEGIGTWEHGNEFVLPDGCVNITLSANINGAKISRTVENSTNDRPVYSDSPTLEQHRKHHLENMREKNAKSDNAESRLDVTLINIYENRFGADDLDRIRYALPGIDNREDCADFKLSSLLRVMLEAGDKIPEDLKSKIKKVILNFRYWMDEKGSDGMCFWSENHALGFYGCQLMAGKLYPDDKFSRSGRTGKQQYEVANSRCREWLDSIENTKFEEFLSPGYMNVTFSALLVLVDYAMEDVSKRAWKVLDMLLEMVCMHFFDGSMIAPNGRIYGNVIKPFKQDMQSTISFFNKDIPVFSGGKIAPYLISKYEVPSDLVKIMNSPVNKVYNTGNAQVSICKTDNYILTSVASERSDDFKGGWSGDEVRKENPYETGNFSFMYVKALNEKYHGTTLFQPGVYGYQQHMWSAALSNECVVLVNHPGATNQTSTMRPGYWYGNGLFPALRQWDNTLLGIYSLDDKHPINFTHMYFPTHTFDQVHKEGNWIFGMTKKGMIGIWCSVELVPHNDVLTDCEYRAYGKNQAYICICSDIENEKSFDKFRFKCNNMNIRFDEKTLTLNDGNGHEIKYIAKYNDTQVI